MNLNRLRVGGAGVTDAGLKRLAGMRKINAIYLKGRFTDQGLTAIDGLTNLQGLELDTGGSFRRAQCRHSGQGFRFWSY